MIDQEPFAPPRVPANNEQAEPSPPPTREQISAIACDLALKLGAPQVEGLSCLRAKLSDAKGWLTASGADAAPIWLVIVRATVEMPRAGGSFFKVQRLEIAIDGTDGRPLGFRIAN